MGLHIYGHHKALAPSSDRQVLILQYKKYHKWESRTKQNKNREEINKSWSYQVTQEEVLLPQESASLCGNQTSKTWALEGHFKDCLSNTLQVRERTVREVGGRQSGMEAHFELCLALLREAGERKWKEVSSKPPPPRSGAQGGCASLYPHAWSWSSVSPNTHRKKRSGVQKSYQVVKENGTT